MSIAELTSVHEVDVYLDTESVGAGMGVGYTQALVSSGVACRVEQADARTVRDYAARGMAVTHQAYFSTDPSLGPRHRLVFGSRNLRVLGSFPEQNRAGEDVMWVVPCEQVTSRSEAPP